MNETTVPYIVYEGEQARSERTIRRLTIALVVTVILSLVLLVGSNCAWLYAWCQYDYSSYELSTDGDGNANYIENGGEINN